MLVCYISQKYSAQNIIFEDIYEDLKLIDGSSSSAAKFEADEKFQVRKVTISESKFALVFEYLLNHEGIAYIAEPVPETEDDPQFRIHADYLGRELPFILATITIDASKAEQAPFEHLFETDDFGDDGVLTGKSRILGHFNKFDWESNQLQTFNNLGQTHLFMQFVSDKSELSSVDFSIRMKAGSPSSFPNIDIPQFDLFSGDSYQQIGRDMLREILQFGYERARLRIENADPEPSQEELQDRLKDLDHKKTKADLEAHELIDRFLELVEQNKADVFDFASLKTHMDSLAVFLKMIKDDEAVASAGLFYLSKYLYESRQGNLNPMEIVAENSKADNGEFDRKNNFMRILVGLSQNLTVFLDRAFLMNGFDDELKAIVGEFSEKIPKFYSTLDLDDAEAVEIAQKEIKQFFSRNHINKIVVLSLLIEQFEEFMSKLETDENEAAREHDQDDQITYFQKFDMKMVVNKYFCLNYFEKADELNLEYKMIHPNLFQKQDRRLLLT